MQENCKFWAERHMKSKWLTCASPNPIMEIRVVLWQIQLLGKEKTVIYSMSITPSKLTMMGDHTFYDVLALKTDFEGLKILKSWVNG